MDEIIKRIERKASEHRHQSAVEIDALESVYAYEEFLMAKHNGRRVRATYTWRMLKKRGTIEALERLMRSTKIHPGLIALIKMGLKDLTFEAVVLSHPDSFTEEAVKRAKERLEKACLSLGIAG